VASEGDRRADPEVASRRSRLLEGLRVEGEGARGVAIALLSTAVFATVVLVAITRSAGWPEVRRAFFDWGDISSSFPDIARAFVLNVKIFLVCEVFILVLALVVAVPAEPAWPGLLPAARLGRDLHRPGARRADDPRDRAARIRCAGPAAHRRPELARLLGRRRPDPHLRRLRGRGLPGRDRVGAPEPGGGGALARPLALPGRCAA